MSSQALALFAAYAMVTSIPASNGAQEAGEVDLVAGREDAHQRMTVPVRIGDSAPLRFLLDTGAENTVVAETVAAQLALPPGANATVVGVAGRQVVATVEIEEIALGKRSYYGLLAPLLQSHHIGADGIIGLDSLQGQRVLLDFDHNLIAVGDSRTVGGDSGYEIVVRARRRSGQLIITNAEIEGVRADIVIDTGADYSIGNRALQRALGKRGNLAESVLTSVTGQQIGVQVGMARELTIDNLTIANVGIAFADAPAFAQLKMEQRPALLLGMRELRSFKRIAIDFSSRRVSFDIAERPRLQR